MTTPVSLEDLKTIEAIAARAVSLYARMGLMDDKDARFATVAIADEILTVHRDVLPLRLDDLLKTDDGNFAHDIAGIHRHLEHNTRVKPAHLRDGFTPRFTRRV